MISDTEKYAVPKTGKYNFKKVQLDDPMVWAAFARGETIGVFQLEKQLGQDWSKRLKPESIEQLAALVAILRPASLESGMADDYCDRKNGKKELEYFHPSLEPIFKDTYGCNLYQEQSILIGKVIAGMTEEEADTYIRKGIGKKLPEVIAECKKRFLEGAKKVGKVTEAEAQEIFSWLEKAQRYQFNASHSFEYAITSYQTMYAKVHFPTEFFCAWLSYADWKPDPKEEIYQLVQDAKRKNIQVMPPDISLKNKTFQIVREGVIAFGLQSIKGVGEKAIDVFNNIDIKTFNDFLLNSKKIKRNICEALIKSGACDKFGIPRMQMLKCLWTLLGRNDKESEEQLNEAKKLTDKEYPFVLNLLKDGVSLSDALIQLRDSKSSTKNRKPVIESKIKWLEKKLVDNNRQKAIWEKIYLGLNLSCSAADDFAKTEAHDYCRNISFIKPKEKIKLYCVVDDIHMKKTGPKSKTPGRDYCYLGISDNTGAIQNLVIWPDLYENFKDYLFENTVIQVDARKEVWNNRDQVICTNLEIIG